MVGTFAAILAGMVLLGFIGAATVIAAVVAFREGVFEQRVAGPPVHLEAAAEAPPSALSEMGMRLMKTPALSADAARAFYHAARIDPGDGSNARLAAVACESAAIAELRFDVERRTLSEDDKKRARDQALAMPGDEARQAALERAARLLPADVELRAALDAARQQRLDQIKALAEL
jgi:hypothetical protein